MFPEHQDLISKLRKEDNHFAKLYDKHTQLDEQISKLDKNPVAVTSEHDEIEKLKKEKLALKDKIYSLIQQKQA